MKERLAERYVGRDWRIDLTEERCLRLGRVTARLQALETLVRFAHQDRVEDETGEPSVGSMAFMARAGDVISVGAADHFVSFDLLRELLEKFNAIFVAHALDLPNLVRLRDSLAHGRVVPLIKDGAPVLKLVKFSRVTPNPARPTYEHLPSETDVECSEFMTPDWFDRWTAFLDGQIERVRAAALGRDAPVSASAPQWDVNPKPRRYSVARGPRARVDAK